MSHRNSIARLLLVTEGVGVSSPAPSVFLETKVDDLPDNFDLSHLRYFLEIIRDVFGRPLGTAIDGGAHRGIWTKELAKHFDEVVAFEARPETFDRLVDNCGDLENVKLYNAALWNVTGDWVESEYHGRNTGASHVVPTEEDDGVHTISLDDTPYTMDFLKLDIEGAELHAIRGARKKIALYQPAIMVEMNGNGERFYNVSDAYLSAFLDGMNYVQHSKQNKDHLFLPR